MSDSDSIPSKGSPDSQEILYEHPAFSYITWQRYQEKLDQPTTYNEYIKYLTKERLSRANTVLFYMDGIAYTCNCYFFRKSQKCFHVLSPATKDFYDKATEKYGNVALPSMLSCDVAPLLNTLKNLTLITQSKGKVIKASATKCIKCNLVFSDLRKLNEHIKSCSQKKLIFLGMVSSWRYELKFPGASDKIVLDTNCILMSRGDLHHLIPLVLKIYDKLETLEIRSSLLQIIAQDPVYQKVADVIVDQKMNGVFGTYYLYLYLVERLLPFLEKIQYENIANKIVPVYTVIRTEDADALKDIIGFDGTEEQQMRVDSCPESCRSTVKEILQGLVDQDLLKPEKKDLLRNMIHYGLRGESKQIWALVVNCLDPQVCMFPIIRTYILDKLDDEVSAEDDWIIHRSFIYGRGTMLGDALTNIFGVIPRKPVRMSTLKRVALFSRGKYIYLNYEPWNRRVKRLCCFEEEDADLHRFEE